MPPVVAPGLHVDLRTGALVDDHTLHGRTGLQCLFHRRKELHFAAPAVSSILRDNGHSLGIVNAVHQRIGGESSEHDRVRCPDTRACQHGDRQFRSHPHVDGYPIALFHA